MYLIKDDVTGVFHSNQFIGSFKLLFSKIDTFVRRIEHVGNYMQSSVSVS